VEKKRLTISTLSIKILQNAKELHLTDSMWGSICYLLECKYNNQFKKWQVSGV
jgi:hypothetical protein